jgi:hypothetical protein
MKLAHAVSIAKLTIRESNAISAGQRAFGGCEQSRRVANIMTAASFNHNAAPSPSA